MAPLPQLLSKPRSPLGAAGRNMVGKDMVKKGYAFSPPGTPPDEPPRLLATAFDQNWKTKRNVPTSAIPGPTNKLDRVSEMSRSVTSFNRGANKKGGFARQTTEPAQPSRFVLGNIDTKFARQITDPSHSRPRTSPNSAMTPLSNVARPDSPLTPTTRNSLARRRSSLKKQDSLPTLLLSAGTIEAEEKAEEEERKRKEAANASEEDEREEKPLAAWAEEAGVPFDLTQNCLETFLQFVTFPGPPEYRVKPDAILFGHPFDAGVDLGSMDNDDFGKACLSIADCKDFSMLPEGFLESAMLSADKDGSGDIDFEEFLYFYYKFSFSEEVLIGPVERQVRKAAREHNIPYDEIGKYKYIFDTTDTNKNGRISFDEFKILVSKLTKVPRGEEVPMKRLKDMWNEATRQGALSDVDFFVFVGWYKRYFMGENHADESPFEAYYHNIRRVSCYDSSQFH